MKKIAVFQNDMGVGGIQKSLMNLLRNIDYDRLEVDLYLSQKNNFWKTDFPEKTQYLLSQPHGKSAQLHAL